MRNVDEVIFVCSYYRSLLRLVYRIVVFVLVVSRSVSREFQHWLKRKRRQFTEKNLSLHDAVVSSSH
jgi:hypothetical protein